MTCSIRKFATLAYEKNWLFLSSTEAKQILKLAKEVKESHLIIPDSGTYQVHATGKAIPSLAAKIEPTQLDAASRKVLEYVLKNLPPQ